MPSDEKPAPMRDRVSAILALHVKGAEEGGLTSGGCKECGLGWPCPTFHFAMGWGEMHDCWDAGWCAHVGELVDRTEAGFPEGLDPDEDVEDE